MSNKFTTSKSREKKSLSEHPVPRQSEQLYKLAIPSQSSQNYNGHLRSSSTSKNRNARIMTDYDEYANETDSYSNQFQYPTNYNSQNSKNKKSFEGRMRDRKSIVLGIGGDNMRGKSFNISHENDTENKVHSTKNNPHMNLELKNLFKSKKPLKPEPKSSVFQHPIMKYFSNKNKYNSYNQPSSILNPSSSQVPRDRQIKRQSPYARQISKFEQIYMLNTRNPSASKQKKRKVSSSQKRDGSVGIGRGDIKIDKDNIKIGIPNCNSRTKYNSKQKVTSFNSKIGQDSLRRRHANNGAMQRLPEEDQQTTVKTIKKSKQQTLQKSNSYNQQSPKSEHQSFQEDSYGLTEEQQETFGDRFPYGFQKVKLLGRGGFSLVWLGKHIKSGKLFAVKQIITQNTHQTHIKEIWFGTMFFMLGGIPKPQFTSFQGIKNLARMYSYQINQTDTWIFYEKCGASLGSTLYDIRSQKVYGDDRLYKIFYKDVYLEMSNDPSILREFLKPICSTLALLSEAQIVHSDLKTQNILIRYSENPIKITQVKLIDYGSSFEFKNISQFSMATPQYMPPEILNYIIHENQGEYESELYEEVMTNYKNPWVVDIWSLGCVMLEIVVGVPLWMSLPLLVPMSRNSNSGSGSYLQKEGLFAVKGRLFPEIIKKQRKVVSMLDNVLKNENHSRIMLSEGMVKILKGMLEIDFTKRISPSQVLDILKQEEKNQKTQI